MSASHASVVVAPLCDLCPRITDALVGACASIGIEHGHTTGEELALYMEHAHATHAGGEDAEVRS